jgi:hypothetical protein
MQGSMMGIGRDQNDIDSNYTSFQTGSHAVLAQTPASPSCMWNEVSIPINKEPVYPQWSKSDRGRCFPWCIVICEGQSKISRAASELTLLKLLRAGYGNAFHGSLWLVRAMQVTRFCLTVKWVQIMRLHCQTKEMSASIAWPSTTSSTCK